MVLNRVDRRDVELVRVALPDSCTSRGRVLAPPWNYKVENVLLMLSRSGNVYYIAFQFRDPFDATSSVSGADLFIAID
uniref:Uncharacterized protein n=1 Tax=Fervidicoccus fontis TaxID=683846 RepID=A0A7J3ZMV9_9CREN